MQHSEENISLFLLHSFYCISAYLDINTKFILSSSIEKDNNLKGVKKVLDICKILEADQYINAIGGQELYQKEQFLHHGIDLKFIKMNQITYPQFKPDFIPNLSIIDVLMFNGKEGTKKLLSEYTLI